LGPLSIKNSAAAFLNNVILLIGPFINRSITAEKKEFFSGFLSFPGFQDPRAGKSEQPCENRSVS